MSYAVFARLDGGVSVVHPAPGVSVADALARAMAVGIVSGTPMVVESLPSRRWRDAWRVAGGGVVVSVSRARAVRARELRLLRSSRLAVLDDAVREAEDAGQGTAALRARRKAVRDYDAAAACAGAASLEELEALAPPD